MNKISFLSNQSLQGINKVKECKLLQKVSFNTWRNHDDCG